MLVYVGVRGILESRYRLRLLVMGMPILRCVRINIAGYLIAIYGVVELVFFGFFCTDG